MTQVGVNIVVYGGDIQAVAAACKAAQNAPDAKVAIIIPDLSGLIGGIATAGGQNYWDTQLLCQGGTFAELYAKYPRGYNVTAFSTALRNMLKEYGSRMLIYEGYDISAYTTVSSPYRITSLNIKNLVRRSDKRIGWGSTEYKLTGSKFYVIDASTEGRIARVVNSACTTGRFDWPTAYLDTSEHSNRQARQQAATLMFKMTGITTPSTVPAEGSGIKVGDMTFSGGGNKPWAVWGGTNEYKTGRILEFNNAHASEGYIIKPVNAAQNGAGSSEWWINAFLVFHVDGRANYRDVGTTFYPQMLAGYRNVDDAWVAARQFLKDNQSEFLRAIRTYPGFENASFVMNGTYPEVADTLYIRETVHMAIDSNDIGHATENSNYELTAKEAANAGSSSSNGTDSSNFSHRIGLAHYNPDIHPYVPDDLKKNGAWVWGYEGFRNLRPDMNPADGTPNYPVYLPYEALLTRYVANLMICGYAAGISSYAWGEARVLPNLCVMGDAAGVATAYCHNRSIYPLTIRNDQTAIRNIQNVLKASPVNAKLNK